jgi:hypothetical protein
LKALHSCCATARRELLLLLSFLLVRLPLLLPQELLLHCKLLSILFCLLPSCCFCSCSGCCCLLGLLLPLILLLLAPN